MSNLPRIIGDCMYCGATNTVCMARQTTDRSKPPCCTICSVSSSHPLLDPADALDLPRMSEVDLRVVRLLLEAAQRGMGFRTLANEVADRARPVRLGERVELATARLELAGLAHFAAGSGVITMTGEEALHAIRSRLNARPEAPTHA